MKSYEILISGTDHPDRQRDGSGSWAIITFLNEAGQAMSPENYSIVEKASIYEKIKNGEPVRLDKCYIKNFSLSEYRKINGLGDTAYVELKDFSAVNSFFDCNKETDFSYASFTGSEVVFGKTHFADGDANFYYSRFTAGKVDFSGAAFGVGDKNFQFAEFSKGNISFQGCRFNHGNVWFVSADFGDGKLNFKETSFGNGEVDFHYAKFGKGDIIFEKAVFKKGDINFSKIEFGEGKVDFKRVDFGDGNVDFSESEFKDGNISFRSSAFGDGSLLFDQTNFGTDSVSFENVNFGDGIISFHNAKANVMNFSRCHINSYCDLRVTKVEMLDLSDIVLRDIIDLQPHISPVEIKTINFSGTKILGKIFVSWKDNNVYDLIYSQQNTDFRSKAYQFNMLKRNFSNIGRYDDEDYAYIEFKRCEMKNEKLLSKNTGVVNSFVKNCAYYFKSLVFDKMGLFATSPGRVLLSSATVYVLFSFIYIALPYFSDSDIISSLNRDNIAFELNSSPIGRGFYHSAITLFTIGYGDYYPHGYARVVSAIEGWIGIFTMSYFVVAFVRKILR